MANNVEFFLNNVDPTTQVKFPYYFDGAPRDDANLKVMFVGNSITIHEPKPDINWYKKCGMAASDLQHDYVHLVYSYLCGKYQKVSICAFNGGQWEKDFTNVDKLNALRKCYLEFNPDILIIRIGENFNRDYLKEGIDPYIGFANLMNAFEGGKSKKIITSLFWRNNLIDDAIVKIAMEYKLPYIDISDLGTDRKFMAFSQYPENEIFLSHPGDLGMQEIANRIIKTIEQL